MDLSATIRELRAEKERLEHAISLLEQLQGKGGAPEQIEERVAREAKTNSKVTRRREKIAKENKPLDPVS